MVSGLFVMICMASCKKSSGDIQPKTTTDTSTKPVVVVSPKKTLFGKWNLVAERYIRYRDGVSISDIAAVSAPYNLAYVIFKSDSTFTALSMAWYPALSTYGVLKDDPSGNYRLTDSTLFLTTYLPGLTTISFGGVPSNPPALTPVSDKITLRKYTDSTVNVHHEYIFNATDPSTGPTGTYKYIWDLFYNKEIQH